MENWVLGQAVDLEVGVPDTPAQVDIVEENGEPLVEQSADPLDRGAGDDDAGRRSLIDDLHADSPPVGQIVAIPDETTEKPAVDAPPHPRPDAEGGRKRRE